MPLRLRLGMVTREGSHRTLETCGNSGHHLTRTLGFENTPFRDDPDQETGPISRAHKNLDKRHDGCRDTSTPSWPINK